jgi:hypothetical protein
MRTCKLCGTPINTVETLATELVRLEADLARVPTAGNDELRSDVLGYLAEEIRPRLLYAAAELIGVHFECRVNEAARVGRAFAVNQAARGDA